MNIAFCINRLALIGLGVTVSSLVRNCSDNSKPTIWFLCSGLSDLDKENIKNLFKVEKFEGDFNFLDFCPIKEFGDLRSLHGDWTTYGRLLLPELLIDVDTVVYLDADLAIELDILDFLKIELDDHPLGAVFGSTINFTLDKDYLVNDYNLPLTGRYFNAGVLLMNLAYWRKHNLKDLCMLNGRLHPNKLLSADQSLLNAMFSTSFKELPGRFNNIWYPNMQRPKGPKDTILHFVGSPKPWDIAGNVLHFGYDTWATYLNSYWYKLYGNKTFKDVIRAWHIRKSYMRLIKKKLFA